MNFVHELNIMADSWAWQTAYAAWQAALVGCVAVLFVRLATRLPAQLRYAILLVALAKFAVPPLLSLPTGMFGFVAIAEIQGASGTPMNESISNTNNEPPIGSSRQPMDSNGLAVGRATKIQRETNAPVASSEPDGSSAIPSARDMLAGAMQMPLSESTSDSVHANDSPVAQSLTPWVVSRYQSVVDALFAVSVFGWLALTHFTGMLILAALLAVRLRSLHRRNQTMSHPEARLEVMYRETAGALGVRRLPELLISAEKTGPYSFGVLRPTIVIPATCTEHLNLEAVRIVLAHELVHHRRGDLVVNTIQIAIAIVWWFHPVVWILNKSIRRVREDCCDDSLLEAGVTQASDYCQTLLDVANLCDCRRPRTGIAIGMTTDKVPLAARFCRIMDTRIVRRSGLSWLAGLVLILVALVVLPGISQKSTAVALAPQDQNNVVTPTAQFTVVDERERTPLPPATDFYVLDNEGQPLVDAPVEVHLTYPNRKEKVTNARSDERGVVRVQWPQQRPNWMSVTVKSSDYVFQTKQWNQQPIQCKVPPTQYEFKLIKGVAIGGIVTDSTKGIEGVTVSAAISSPSASEDYMATTGVGGRWEIQNAPSEIKQINLQLAHHDYQSDANQWSRPIDESDIDAMQSEDFVAKMIQGKDLSGKVTDEFGVPIPGVQLMLLSRFPADHALTPRSDEQGNFRFPHCPPDLESFLVAFHPKFAPTRIPIHLQGESMVQDVELSKGTPIRFKVTGPDGLPVAGVSLSLDQWSGVFNTLIWDDEFDIPETDENGNCVWQCAPEEPITYGLFRYGWTRPRLENVLPMAEPIEVQMYPEPIVTVRVFAEESGEVVQDFKLITGEFQSTRRLKRYEAKQFTEGQAQLKINESAHQYFVRVESPGYAAAESELHDAKEGNVELVFKLKRTKAVSGVVREPDGSLAIGATVIMGTKAARPLIRAGGETSNHDLRVTSGEDGAFSFADPGDDFTLFVFSKNGFTHIRKQDFKSPAEIEVRPYARVEGELLHVPAAGQHTQIKFHIDGEWGGGSFFGPHCFLDIETKSDAQGKFTLELPGEVNGRLATAIVLGKDAGMTTMGNGPSQTLSLVAGETVHVTLGQVGRRVIGHVGLDADIDPNCRFGYGSFTLASQFGEPFKPNINAPTASIVVDESGAFEIEDVPPGKYQLLIDAWENSDDHRNRKTVGRFQRWFTVPERDAGQPEDQEFDLGECMILSNGNTQTQAAVQASGRDLFKLPRTNNVAESFNVQIHCVDSAEQPVQANVKTWYGDKSGIHIETLQTNASGEVSLDDVPTHGAWVFVTADGFQTTGMLVGADSKRVEVELVRNEQNQPVVQRMGWEQADTKFGQMAKFLLGRTVNRILEGSDESLKFSSLLLLAKYDARAALDMHAKYAIDYPAIGDEQRFSDFTDAAIRVARCVELAADDPDAADQLLMSIKDGRDRARGYAMCVAALAEADGGTVANEAWIQPWIELAFESVEIEPESNWRAESLAAIAQTLLNMGGLNDLARSALEKAQAALEVPSDDERWYYARSVVAWELARIDVDAALHLVQSEIDAAKTDVAVQTNATAPAKRDMREAERGRLLGNLAHQIALSDSLRAIQVLDACSGETRDNYCSRVCYRIAKSDVEQALALAESCGTRLARGQALGAIADALSERDRERALEILRRAFDELEKVPVSEEKIHMAVSVACALLPTVAKIDPQLLDTYKWRALAMRTSKQCHSGCRGAVCDLGLVDQTSQLRLGDGLLGATLARYDAKLGRQIAFAAGDDTLDLSIDKAPYYLFGIAFLTAPQQTVLALENLPLETSVQQRVALSAMEQVVGLVGLDETERWNWLLDEQYQLWRPDKFDF